MTSTDVQSSCLYCLELGGRVVVRLTLVLLAIVSEE